MGAAQRFATFLGEFSDVPDQDKALFLLGKCYIELGQAENASHAFNKIVTEYPNSSYARESKAILEGGVKVKKPAPSKGAPSRTEPALLETVELEQDRLALVKFEEEGRQAVSLDEAKKAREDRPKAAPVTEPVKPAPGRTKAVLSRTRSKQNPLQKQSQQSDRTDGKTEPAGNGKTLPLLRSKGRKQSQRKQSQRK
jgi:tetratricopeptide (TPR) repeat protein